jgi:hypothetical protein
LAGLGLRGVDADHHQSGQHAVVAGQRRRLEARDRHAQDRGDARIGGQSPGEIGDAVEGLWLLRAIGGGHHDLHRPDAARTECGGQPVERHPGRTVSGQGVGARLPEHDPGQRSREQQQDPERGEQVAQGSTHHPRGPHVPAGYPVSRLVPAEHGEPVDARTDEDQHCGQERQAGEYRQGDHHHGAHCHRSEALDVHQEHPGQRDDDGEAGHGDAAA